MKTKLLKPLSLEETKGAPLIRVRCAAKLTGLGETILRRLPCHRIGNADYVGVTEINRLITGEKEETK